MDTVGFLLWLAGDPGFSGKAGNTCRRLSAPWIVYAGLLKGLAAVKISKKCTVCLTKIVYVSTGSDVHSFGSVLT